MGRGGGYYRRGVGGRGLISAALLARPVTRSSLGQKQLLASFTCTSLVSLSPPSTFLCVTWSCTVVDKNAHAIGAIQKVWKNSYSRQSCRLPRLTDVGVVFRLWICPRVGSQNRNGLIGIVRDPWHGYRSEAIKSFDNDVFSISKRNKLVR
jgi:hypothetical protein